MPLIKRGRDAAAPPQPAPDQGDPMELLRSPDAAERRRAARVLASDPEALAGLSVALASEPEPAVREAIFAALVSIGGDPAVRALVPVLRSEDAGLRNGALEALQDLADALGPHVPGLLADADSDVRILAAELARRLPPAEATAALCAMLEREAHPNACGAALDVLTEVGTADALPTLRAVADRFAADAFIPFAVQVAIARIQGTRG